MTFPFVLTHDQRLMLQAIAGGPMEVYGPLQCETARELCRSKWATQDGKHPYPGPWVLTITEAGRKALRFDSRNRKR